jgi:L-seryl-tRNA(Ser) seleniumtransferase
MRRNPLHRALRLDKFTLAALEGTLRLYLEGDRAVTAIPTLRMISEPAGKVRQRARRLYRRLSRECRHLLRAAVVSSTAQVGGGALPLQELPSAAVALGGEERPAHQIEEALRKLPLPVIGRIQESRLLLDLRTVQDGEVARTASSIEAITGL